jgi:hypothetical protein
MKASVQYGDFKGTSAADISDHENLESVLNRLDVDTNQYEAVGASFYSGTNNFFVGYIIVLDKNRSSDDNPYLVKIDTGFDKDQFFEMFKRLDVVLESRFKNYDGVDVKDTIHLEEL